MAADALAPRFARSQQLLYGISYVASEDSAKKDIVKNIVKLP